MTSDIASVLAKLEAAEVDARDADMDIHSDVVREALVLLRNAAPALIGCAETLNDIAVWLRDTVGCPSKVDAALAALVAAVEGK